MNISGGVNYVNNKNLYFLRNLKKIDCTVVIKHDNCKC